MKLCVYAVGRHRWRGLSIGVCQKEVVETLVDRIPREGEGEEGMCIHERKLVVATKVRGLCGCKRLTKIII